MNQVSHIIAIDLRSFGVPKCAVFIFYLFAMIFWSVPSVSH